MTRAEFSRRILDMGGTYADVNRLEKEGFNNAWDAHITMWETGELSKVETETDFISFCYSIGYEFVLDNMGDEFTLEHPERAEEQRKINRYHYFRNRNESTALNLMAYLGECGFSKRDKDISWADVSEMQRIFNNLVEICKMASIEVPKF